MNIILKINTTKEIILELIYIVSFIGCNYFITGYISMIVYTMIFICYLIYEKNHIRYSYQFIKAYIK